MEYVLTGLFVIIPLMIVTIQRFFPQTGIVNPIIVSYVAGLLLSPLLPHTEAMTAVQDGITSLTVALSIPLMLFAVDIRGWMRAGREAIVSLILAGMSVIVAVIVAHVFLSRFVQFSPQIGGLLVGVYTGGTPNLAAIRLALGVESSLYLTVHTVDLLVSALYILLILALGRRLVTHDHGGEGTDSTRKSGARSDWAMEYHHVVARGMRGKTVTALGAALVVVGASVGISMLFPEQSSTTVTILSLTTLALVATLFPGISRLTTSFKLGEFLILIFSVAVASMADIGRIVTASPIIIVYMSIVVFGSLSLHMFLGRVFRIRNATIMVTSISAVCSPPFVGMLAPIVRDPQLIAAGITTGIIGYAVGNYLGIAMASLLAAL